MTRAPEGSIVHLDVATTDEEATRAFFEVAFGWKHEAIPLMRYAMAQLPAPPHGGVRRVEAGEAPRSLVYLAVDDLEAASDRIKKAGGSIVSGPDEVPGFGRLVVFDAPGGVRMGAFEER